MKRTAITLVVVCLVSMLLAGFRLGMLAEWPALMDWTGTTYAITMMLVDAIAAAVILIRPSGKAQALIGVTLVCQMGFYAGRLLNGSNSNINHLWWGLSVLAFAQLVLVGGWWLYERVDWRRPFRGVRPAPVASHRKGVG